MIYNRLSFQDALAFFGRFFCSTLSKKIMEKIKGQPKKEKHIRFWLTNQQDFLIRQKAAKAGLTIPDYLRQVAVNGVVKPKWTEEEQQMVRRLTEMYEDIHQLVEQAQKEGVLPGALLFTKYKGILDEIANTLCYNY